MESIYCQHILADLHPILGFQIVSFIVAMTGIIMITYMDSGFDSEDLWGSVLAMTATAGAAAYQVHH